MLTSIIYDSIHFATTGMFMLNNMKTTTTIKSVSQKSSERQRQRDRLRLTEADADELMLNVLRCQLTY